MDILLVVLLFALFPLPWALLWLGGRREVSAEDAVDALSLGSAFSFCLLYLCAELKLTLFVPVWLAGAAAAALRLRGGRPKLAAGPEGRLLGGVLLGCLALWLAPVLVCEYPGGWDPYFHLILVKKIAAAGHLVRDWAPYETVPLNYPLGSHLLLALVSGLAGAAPHKVFLAGMAWFAAAGAAQVFSLASRASGRRELGLYAAAAYSFAAVNGSLDYYRWGGLPNQAGMGLYLGLLSLLLSGQPRRREAAAFAALFVGLSLVHHHVMLMAGLTLIWAALYFAAAGPRSLGLRIASGLVLSGLAGLPYYLSYLKKIPTLGETNVIAGYLEAALTPAKIVSDFGPAYLILTLGGLALWLRRRAEAKVSPLPLQCLAVNLVLFVGIEYGWRWYSAAHGGREEAPFTPARFLTDAAALLAVFPALLAAELRSRLRWSEGAAAALLAACFVFSWGKYAKYFEPALSPERLEAYAWIRSHADADAVLIDRAYAASYLTDRVSSDMPMPSSEPRRGATMRPMTDWIKKHRAQVPPEAGRRQILLVWDGDPAQVPAQRVVWRNSAVTLVQLNPRELKKG